LASNIKFNDNGVWVTYYCDAYGSSARLPWCKFYPTYNV